MNDLKFAFRQLLKNPGFTAVAVLTLALGIGANTAIFSVWNSVFLRPLAPVRPEEMVAIISNERSDATEGSSSYADYLDYREQTMEVLSAVIASGNFPSAVNFGTERGTQRAWAGFVSADYFPVLGVKPIAGRFFLPEEDKVPGRDSVYKPRQPAAGALGRPAARGWRSSGTWGKPVAIDSTTDRREPVAWLDGRIGGRGFGCLDHPIDHCDQARLSIHAHDRSSCARSDFRRQGNRVCFGGIASNRVGIWSRARNADLASQSCVHAERKRTSNHRAAPQVLAA